MTQNYKDKTISSYFKFAKRFISSSEEDSDDSEDNNNMKTKIS